MKSIVLRSPNCSCNGNLKGQWWDVFGIEDKAHEFCVEEAKKELKKYVPAITIGLIVSHMLFYSIGKENGKKK